MIAVVPVKHFAQLVELIKRSDKDRDFDKRRKIDAFGTGNGSYLGKNLLRTGGNSVMLRSGTERGEPRNIKRVSVLNRMNVGRLDLAQFRVIFRTI